MNVCMHDVMYIGFWRLLCPNYINKLFQDILDAATENDWAISAIPVQACITRSPPPILFPSHGNHSVRPCSHLICIFITLPL